MPLWDGDCRTLCSLSLWDSAPGTLDLRQVPDDSGAHTEFNWKHEFFELSEIILAFRKDENTQNQSMFTFEGNVVVNGKRVKQWKHSFLKSSKLGKSSEIVSWNPALKSSDAINDECSFLLQVSDVSEKLWP